MNFISKFFLVICFFVSDFCLAEILSLRLPFSNGDSYVITRGYNTPGTHLGKDQYAIDFALKGCEIFDKPVLVVSDGIVIVAENWHRAGGE